MEKYTQLEKETKAGRGHEKGRGQARRSRREREMQNTQVDLNSIPTGKTPVHACIHRAVLPVSLYYNHLRVWHATLLQQFEPIEIEIEENEKKRRIERAEDGSISDFFVVVRSVSLSFCPCPSLSLLFLSLFLFPTLFFSFDVFFFYGPDCLPL